MDADTRYRTFWLRLGATFLDGAAFAPLAWFDVVLWNATSSPFVLFSWTTLYQVLWLLYSVGLLLLFGQTLGKMATGVVVLDVDNRKLSLAQAILRNIVAVILTPIIIVTVARNVFAGRIENRGFGDEHFFVLFGSIGMIWGILEFVTMLSNAKRRSIHDFIAGTVVVRQPIEERRPGYRVVRWVLVVILVLNLASRFVLTDNHVQIEIGKARSEPAKSSER